MNATLRLSRDVPVEDDYDIVVCGGGPAGCAAAFLPETAPGCVAGV